MGDAETLKKFIRFCKANYPAANYALDLWNHGLGVAKKGAGETNNIPDKGICVDFSNGQDYLYTAELTDFLTSEDSVDLIGFDACLMGSIEIAYQYRPDPANTSKFSADIMAASAPSVWGLGWKYDEILKRIKTGGGNNGELNDVTGSGTEAIYDPASMTAANLCDVIVEEQYDSVGQMTNQSLACYDLSKAGAVKEAADTLAVQLYTEEDSALTIKDKFESIRGQYPLAMNNGTLHYFTGDGTSNEEWVDYPFFDLYDLCKRASKSSNFNTTIQGYASAVMAAVVDMIICSFGGSDYTSFENGKNGLFIFFPDGDLSYKSKSHWTWQWWYSPLDTNIDYGTGLLYGKLAWCTGGTTADSVENWFELLDSWYDIPANGGGNLSDGGLNSYQW
jgi:clostripain